MAQTQKERLAALEAQLANAKAVLAATQKAAAKAKIQDPIDSAAMHQADKDSLASNEKYKADSKVASDQAQKDKIAAYASAEQVATDTGGSFNPKTGFITAKPKPARLRSMAES